MATVDNSINRNGLLPDSDALQYLAVPMASNDPLRLSIDVHATYPEYVL